jgi:3-hydroxyisobutyrate dehydrogenase
VNAATVATVGWIGAGRMGVAMATRLLDAGHDLLVWNRTKGKCTPLQERGARLAERPADLAGCRVVFIMVLDDDALLTVTTGEEGVLAAAAGPRVLVDSSTVSPEASAAVAAAAEERGTAFLAAPVSGNPTVVGSGDLAMVASGSRDAFEEVLPLLTTIGRRAVYAGAGEQARLVKLCHNVLVAVTVQALAEALVMAEKRGVSRRAVMDFINGSVLGSRFIGYKTPALVDLDFTTAFTAQGQRKDLRLALDAAREVDAAMPVVAATEQAFTRLIGSGLDAGRDFATLLLLAARDAGVRLEPDP